MRQFRRWGLLVLLPAACFAQSVQLEVDATKPGRTIDRRLYGINTARWDESLFPGFTNEMLLRADHDAIEKVKAAGFTVLKYPGGNDADSYVWDSPDNNAMEMDTDEYIAFCRAVGAEPFITINFNESAELAAEWVRYCNVIRGYNVKLWEVGDEQWGTWAKGHAPPDVYARKYKSFVRAMRAVDPTILVATNVPLGPHPEQWTTRVLQEASEDIDILTYTYFPLGWGKEDDDTLLATIPDFRRLVLDLNREVESVLGKERAEKIIIVNVGYNSVNHSPGPQTLELVNAIWTADMLGTMAETGTDIACFWALHNAFPPRKGDFGVLSSEGSNTPSFSYYVFPIYTRHFAGELVTVRYTDSVVSAYAARNGKKLSLMIINKARKEQKDLRVRLKGFDPQQQGMAWVLDQTRKYDRAASLPALGREFTLTLSPFSILCVELISKDSVLAAQNIARTAQAEASSFSVIGPNFHPESAVDGKLETRWNSAAWTKSNGDEAQWFQLRWENPRRISRVVIQWGGTRAVDYLLEGSVDGKSWGKLDEVRGGSGDIDEFRFNPAKLGFLRMNATKGTKGISAYSIREIEVY